MPSDSEEEDPSGKNSCGQSGARATNATCNNRGIIDEAQGIQIPKLTSKQRQERLFEKLDLNGLGSWPPKLADSAWSLLVEYQNIFSLEPSELGCTHSTEHVIKVTDDGPFKE